MTPNEFILLAKHQPEVEEIFSKRNYFDDDKKIMYHEMIADDIIMFVSQHFAVAFDLDGKCLHEKLDILSIHTHKDRVSLFKKSCLNLLGENGAVPDHKHEYEVDGEIKRYPSQLSKWYPPDFHYHILCYVKDF